MGTKRFSNPQALSSILALLETLQHWTFGLLNRLVSLVLESNLLFRYEACMSTICNNCVNEMYLFIFGCFVSIVVYHILCVHDLCGMIKVLCFL